MRKLLAWCRARGIVVTDGDGSYYYPDTKRIEVNWRLGRETYMFHLLHECGHHLIATSGARHGAANGHTGSLETRVAVLAEEFEAWYRGRRLASRLGIKINRKRWLKCRRECLATYARWV